MQWRDIWPLVIACIATFCALKVLVPYLTKKKVDQTERTEGVKSHLKKAGTPTMGGLGILAGVLLVSLLYVHRFPAIAPIMILTFGFGFIGFLDDFLKVFLKRSDGLIAWQKLLLELVVTGLFLVVLTRENPGALSMQVPFTATTSIDLGWAGVPFAILVILATVNGVNFTDGLDGLASSVTIVVSLFFLAAASVLPSLADGDVLGGPVGPMVLAVIGALLAFLLFNAYPAKIFMGDTGSLALGGFVAGTAYALQLPLFIPIVGFIYAFELVSVALQVSYFKITHGKRIFKMTPIHHHFELCGWSETRIVATFTVITALLCFVALCV